MFIYNLNKKYHIKYLYELVYIIYFFKNIYLLSSQIRNIITLQIKCLHVYLNYLKNYIFYKNVLYIILLDNILKYMETLIVFLLSLSN